MWWQFEEQLNGSLAAANSPYSAILSSNLFSKLNRFGGGVGCSTLGERCHK